MDLLCFFRLLLAMPLYASVYMGLVVTCWERVDLLALACGVLLSLWYPGSGEVFDVSIPDLCTLTYFVRDI